MLEKGKISAFQMGIMMFPIFVATADLLLPGVASQHAGRDMWLTPIMSSWTGFLIVYVLYRLNRLYPDETLIEYMQKIIGRIPGKTIGLLLLFYFLYIDAVVLREYGEFVIGFFLPHTPIIVVIGSMVFICALAVRAGLEVIARSAQLFVPIIIVLYLTVMILLIPDMKPANMLPVLEKGLGPVLKGSSIPIAWYSHLALIAFFLPYLTDRRKGLKWGTISVFACMIMLTLIQIVTLFVMGNLASSLLYPAMTAVRYISIADFLEHLEVIIMATWVVGAFLKITAFYYALALGTAQWAGLNTYRPVILPLGFLLAVFSIWIGDSLQETRYLLSTDLVFYKITFELAVPLFLFVIARIRGQRPQRKGAGKR